MIEEAMVLGGQDRLQQAEGDVTQPHGAVVLAGPVARARENLGLQRGGADVLTIVGHPCDALVAYLDAHALRAAQPGEPAEMDVPGPARAVELSRRLRLATCLG